MSDYRMRMVRDAKGAFPREICGFVVDMPINGLGIVPIENVSPDANRFEMDDAQQLEFWERFSEHVTGMYHSHPSGSRKPSKFDLEHAYRDLDYWIVTEDGAYCWDVSGDEPVEVARP